MRDDIVTRLRNWHTEHDSAFPRPIDLEAADEIERLRAAVERIYDHAFDEIERLRAEIARLKNKGHGNA